LCTIAALAYCRGVTLPAALALFGWIPFALVLFRFLPARRAVIASFIIGWLFLPNASYPILGLPDYTKMFAVCLAPLFGAVVFDTARVLTLRPRMVDVAMIVWCLCPFASSIGNELGAYDGLSAVVAQTVTWGVPYAIGRMYFGDLVALSELARGMLIGGLVYVPLCLIEVFIGPRLHALLYGEQYYALWKAWRFNGWRPAVFMSSGLAVALWMTATTLTGTWLWLTGALTRLAGIRTQFWLVCLFVATLLTRSVNAWTLLLLGSVVLGCVWQHRLKLLKPLSVVCLLAMAPTYVLARATGLWSGLQLVPPIAAVLNADRAQSVEYRLINEGAIVDKALQQPLLGWGRWGRATIEAELGQVGTIRDSLWIIAFGDSGLLGLIAVLTVFVLPPALFWFRYPLERWTEPAVASAAVLAIVIVLYTIDSCFNAMVNPIFMLAAGGLVGLGHAERTSEAP
jgi:hypothetical protein